MNSISCDDNTPATQWCLSYLNGYYCFEEICKIVITRFPDVDIILINNIERTIIFMRADVNFTRRQLRERLVGYSRQLLISPPT